MSYADNEHYHIIEQHSYSCADPERFVRGGPTVNFFYISIFQVGERREDPNKRAIISTPAKRRLNGVSVASR